MTVILLRMLTLFLCIPSFIVQATTEPHKTIELTQTEINWLEAHPNIRMGIDPAWPPIEFISEQDEYQGISSAYIAHITSALKINMMPMKEFSWEDVMEKVKTRDIDLLPALVKTESREKHLNFTDPYLNFPLVIFTRENTTHVNNIMDLKQKRIIVESSYITHELLLSNHPDIKLITVASTGEALRRLAEGEGDAYMGNLVVASYLIGQHGYTNLKVAAPTDYAYDLRIGVRKDWPELIPILQRALDNISTEQKTAILQKWLTVNYHLKSDYRLVWQVAIAAIILLIIILCFYYTVRQQKKRLRISEERFQMAMQTSAGGIWDWNIPTGDVYYSPGYLTMLGYAPDELPAHKKTWENLLHPDDKIGAMATVAEAINQVSPHYEHEFRLRTKSGTYLHILSSGGVVSQNSQGQALRSVGTQTDISDRKKAEDSLRKLSLAVEQSPVMVMITDPLGIIEYVNPKFTEITGYTSQEILGQTPAILKSGLTESSEYKNMWQAITSGQEWHGEIQNKKKDGTIYWEKENISPLLDEKGHIRQYIALKEDITAQKIAEERFRIFHRFAETSGQGFGITKLDGEITYVNNTLRKMLGESSDENVFKKSFEQYYSTETQIYFQTKILPTLKEKNQWTGELTLIDKNGQKHPTLGNLFVIRNECGKARFFGSVITDITLQKSTEQALQTAKEHAETASRFKSEFLANMSHEIRTPLNAIMGMAYLTQKTTLSSQQQNYINNILFSSSSLLGVINDILDFSKIEAGHLDIENTDFFLDDVFQSISSLDKDNEIELIYAIEKDVPHKLVGDPLRLGQVLINLTSNAIKFTEKGQVIITVRLHQKNREKTEKIQLYFSVQDTGIGIDKAQAEHIFDPFTQADGSTSRKYGGSGLGLAICKQLVSMMNGKIEVESQLGHGSIFYFTAEFGCSHNALEKQYMPISNLRGTRVLVVDKNAATRQALQTMLESFTFNVNTVASGTAALEKLIQANKANMPYELLLMDSDMPDLNGIDTISQIRRNTQLTFIPDIILLISTQDAKILDVSHTDIDHYLVKPISPSTLFDAVINLLTSDKKNKKTSPSNNESHTMLQGVNILIVEDNLINQQVAKELLECVGARVTVADSGKTSLKLIKNNPFDLVLMDLQMPGLDGYQTTRAIRKNPQFKHLPIIAMTAHAMVGDREKCLIAGMNDHLPKPIDPNLLYHTISQWITQSKRTPQAVKAKINPLSSSKLHSFPEKFPGIDLKKGLLRVNSNPNLFRTLLLNFVEDHQQDIKKLNDALTDKKFQTARRIVHTLRGVAGTIGAEHLEKSAKTLELAFIKEEMYTEFVGPFSDAFHTVLNGLIAEINTLKNGEPENPTAITQDQCENGIRMLKKQLVDGSIGAKDDLVRCYPFLLQHASTAQVSLLKQQIDCYDFADALETLNRILKDRNGRNTQGSRC